MKNKLKINNLSWIKTRLNYVNRKKKLGNIIVKAVKTYLMDTILYFLYSDIDLIYVTLGHDHGKRLRHRQNPVTYHPYPVYQLKLLSEDKFWL